MSEFSSRQINQMIRLVKSTKRRETQIGTFVGDMWMLLDLVEDVSLDWKKKVRNFVDEIEIIYAIRMADDSGRLSEQEENRIDSILDSLLVSLNEYFTV